MTYTFTIDIVSNGFIVRTKVPNGEDCYHDARNISIFSNIEAVTFYIEAILTDTYDPPDPPPVGFKY